MSLVHQNISKFEFEAVLEEMVVIRFHDKIFNYDVFCMTQLSQSYQDNLIQ